MPAGHSVHQQVCVRKCKCVRAYPCVSTCAEVNCILPQQTAVVVWLWKRCSENVCCPISVTTDQRGLEQLLLCHRLLFLRTRPASPILGSGVQRSDKAKSCWSAGAASHSPASFNSLFCCQTIQHHQLESGNRCRI